MRFRAILLASAALASAGCSDPITLDLWDDDGCGFMSVCPEWGSVGGSSVSLRLNGEAWIGDYRAIHDEVSILVFRPGNLEVPVDSLAASWDGEYSVDLGNVSPTAACAYHVKAIRWDGVELPLRPVAEDPATCMGSAGIPAPRFDFPAYEPLDEPLVLMGAVRMEGEPPGREEVAVETRIRMPEAQWADVELLLNDRGAYRLETTDRAQWFALCHQPAARVESPGGTVVQADLSTVDRTRCQGRLPLPTARFDQIKAALGWVLTGSPAVPVVGGGATVELLDSADGSTVGQSHFIEVDGRYSLWLPPEEEAPRCDLEIRITYEDGATETRPLLGGGSSCEEGRRVDFHVRDASS